MGFCRTTLDPTIVSWIATSLLTKLQLCGPVYNIGWIQLGPPNDDRHLRIGGEGEGTVLTCQQGVLVRIGGVAFIPHGGVLQLTYNDAYRDFLTPQHHPMPSSVRGVFLGTAD